MKNSYRTLAVFALMLTLALAVAAQAKKTGVLEATELKQIVPTQFFFDDQVAPVQMRNAMAIRSKDNHIVAAGLVDNSGYSSDVQQKYQGFLITAKKIGVEGHDLAAGEYGFGFTKDGKFNVLDAGGNTLFTVSSHADAELKRPQPLKAAAAGSDFRLYNGKNYVTLKVD